ncbi:hypothetical protein EVA_19148 [gut metagenome]|uniref:Uncharacterized protein n=1 Tax=gut metagenome TaxID=749906 RepID=J9FT48_9ZZZZ
MKLTSFHILLLTLFFIFLMILPRGKVKCFQLNFIL